MPTYTLRIKGDKEAEIEIVCDNNHVAINEALNAPSQFSCNNFPPPAHVSITVQDAAKLPLAAVSMAFTIELIAGVQM